MCRPAQRSGAGIAAVLLVLALDTAPAAAWELHSYARVNADASLLISGETVRLAGIHIPETANTCKTISHPPICGSRARIALAFKIDRFVRCDIFSRNNDDSLNGQCFINSDPFDPGEDLAAYLLERGWAVALPRAPIEYLTLERVARSRGLGIWGMPIDNYQGKSN